jgi:tetratricopeptide (TPR) repeat protein
LELATKADPQNLDYQASFAQAVALTDPAPLKGVSMLREILKKDPKHQKTWYILGVLAIQSNQLDKANGRFSFLNENYPNFPDAWYYRAQVLYSLGKTDSTVICLQKFKSLINDPVLKKEVQKQIEEVKTKS